MSTPMRVCTPDTSKIVYTPETVDWKCTTDNLKEIENIRAKISVISELKDKVDTICSYKDIYSDDKLLRKVIRCIDDTYLDLNKKLLEVGIQEENTNADG